MSRAPALLLAALLCLAAGAAAAAAPARVVPAGTTVRGPLQVEGHDVLVRGTVKGDLLVTGGNVSVEPTGVVTGGIRVVGGDVSLANGARVEGSIQFSRRRTRLRPAVSSPAKPAPAVGAAPPAGTEPAAASAPGETPARDRGFPGRFLPTWLHLPNLLELFAGVLACLVLIQALFPYRIGKAGDAAVVHPLNVSLVGLLLLTSAAALAAAIFLLTQSLLGSVLALLFLGPTALLGLAGAAPVIGRRAIPPRWQDGGGTAAILVGGLLWEATLLVPVLGWALAAATVVWGLGAFVCSFRDPNGLPPARREAPAREPLPLG